MSLRHKFILYLAMIHLVFAASAVVFLLKKPALVVGGRRVLHSLFHGRDQARSSDARAD
jgi:hypothetical protein